MDINVKEVDGCLVVGILLPKIDYTTCGAIKSRIISLIEEKNCRCLLINLEGVTFMDSMSIGAMVSIRKNIVNRGGKFALCSLHPFVSKVLGVVTVNAIFDVYDDETVAMTSLGGA